MQGFENRKDVVMPVHKDPDGRWRYRSVITLSDGAKVRINGSAPKHHNTKEAAKQAERDHVVREQLRIAASPLVPAPTKTVAVSKKEEPAKQNVNFNDFANEFMATYAKTNNKPSEQKNKDLILKRHLRPAFKDLTLGEIRVREIEQLKAELLDGKRSRKTVNNVLACLGKILRYAHELELIDRVPRIRLLKVDKQSFRFLDFEQYEALLAAAKPEPGWYAAILLGGDAGLRLGEIRALRWEDVDLKTDRITVGRSLWQNQEGATKGWNLRTIPLTRRLRDALKQLRHARLAKYVLVDEDGDPLNLEMMRWNLPRLCRKAQIMVVGWHSLRHTFCSHLALGGAPSRVIQELAGHASVSTTLRYMHLVPGATDQAIALLNDRRAKSVTNFVTQRDASPDSAVV
jgi:integrase